MIPYCQIGRARNIGLVLLLAGCSTAQSDVAQLAAFTLADVDAANRWAIYNDDRPAMQCLATLREVIVHLQSDQAAGVQYGAITYAQMAGDLVNPNSRLRADCAALAAERKAQVQQSIGQIMSFAASPGLAL